jgi:hypothetical protein
MQILIVILEIQKKKKKKIELKDETLNRITLHEVMHRCRARQENRTSKPFTEKLAQIS